MSWFDWCIMIIPFASVVALAIYAKKYSRDVVDFLAAGRVAGRYVISVGDVAAGLSVITLVAASEATYRAGQAMGFWNILTTPLGMILALTGYCTYRYRATKALSVGQFLERRYSRSFRIFAATLRNIAEMVTNAIGPAIAANFFIYFLGLPHRVHVFGVNLPCFGIIVAICLTLAMIVIWPAGRISLLVTDTFQGLLSYPIFVIVAGYIFFKFSWGDYMVPVMLDRVPGESFLDPFDIAKLRDFNLFALAVTITSTLLQRASWFGNDTTNSGRTPHEQKMAGVLGTWRNGFSWTMIGLVSLLVITVMNHEKFFNPKTPDTFSSHETRIALINKVADEAVPSPEVREQIRSDLEKLDPPTHRTYKDPVPDAIRGEHDAYFATMRQIAEAKNVKDLKLPEPSPELAAYLKDNLPLSHLKNVDTPYIDLARDRIHANLSPELQAEADRIEAARQASAASVEAGGEPLDIPTPSAGLAAAMGANAKQAQQVRTLYGQMMMPITLKRILPPGLLGLFGLLMLMLLISTDDSRIFNASSTWAQDVILPLFKKPPSSRQHILILRLTALAVTIFFFIVAIFFSQLDYINMFTTIMCSLWLGGGGSVMIFGLYSRFGNTVGAWCSIIFGSGSSLVGLIAQRTWSASIVPFLARNGWTEAWFSFFAKVVKPLNPWVDWSYGFNSGESTYAEALQLFCEKFPPNSMEIYFLSMVLSVGAYVIGSWVAIKCGKYGLFNLDKMLNRGEYADEEEKERIRLAQSKRVSILSRLVGITNEYTTGDRIIAWSVFIYTIGYRFILTFVVVWIWNVVSPWPKAWWGTYYYVTSLIIPMLIGIVSTVWFMWGGIKDLFQLFRDLDARVIDTTDNGMR
ncbi:MAG: sodium:solute symporter family transporter [Kiritimatiellia bacterium]